MLAAKQRKRKNWLNPRCAVVSNEVDNKHVNYCRNNNNNNKSGV